MNDRILISKPRGAVRKRKILGRGAGTGYGSTSGRGTKGQNSRSGGGVRPGYEGGQMPLYRRIARRGFSNYPFRKSFVIIKLEALNIFKDGEKVNRESLIEKGLMKAKKTPVKILGNGEITKKLIVEVDKVTKGAMEKILKSGGEVINGKLETKAGKTKAETKAGKTKAETKAETKAGKTKAGKTKAETKDDSKADSNQVKGGENGI